MQKMANSTTGKLWFAKRIVEKLAVLGELDMLF